MKDFKPILLLALLFLLNLNCSPETKGEETKGSGALAILKEALQPAQKKEYKAFDRAGNIERLAEKIKNGTSISIHLRVPLCDNENQGIVPVSQKLGDGLDLRNNLYWGARYGVKNHFKNISSWKLLASKKDLDQNILERVIFYKEYPNKAKVYLIADAYRGDKMKGCLEDFIHSISGNLKEEIKVGDELIKISSGADLLVFNGHNGLMDYNIDFVETADEKVRDVSVIGCISHEYFVDHLKHSKGYPLLMTTNLMAPESYVVNALIDAWVMLKETEAIRQEAGKAYHKYQKCGIKGATRLFKTGW